MKILFRFNDWKSMNKQVEEFLDDIFEESFENPIIKQEAQYWIDFIKKITEK